MKNYLERNKVIARSQYARFLRLLGIRKMYWNSVQPAKQERIFSPQTGPGIFGSAADCVSLGRMFFCAKCHQNWVKDYLQGMQQFTTHSIGAYNILTAPADLYPGRCTRRPLASNFAFNILINMYRKGCRLYWSFQPSESMRIITITTTTAPWIKCLLGKLNFSLKWVRHKEVIQIMYERKHMNRMYVESLY